MLVSREREKLLNAIVYFVRNRKHCHTLKLFKLLNFLDFEHYRQTGRTVTGLRYKAWPEGPAPDELWREISGGGNADLREIVAIIEDSGSTPTLELRTIDHEEWSAENNQRRRKRIFKPKKPCKKSVFTKRELAIMERLAEFFKEFRADDMSEFSHMKGLPWRTVYSAGAGKGETIPPELSFNADPIMHEMPTIEPDELRYRESLLSDL